MASIVNTDFIPNAPIIEAFKRSGMSYQTISTVTGIDSSSVAKMLGRPYYNYVVYGGKRKPRRRYKYGPYTQQSVSYDNALKLIRAMNLDPVDFGC